MPIRKVAEIVLLSTGFSALALSQSSTIPWSGYGHDPQHSGVSATAAQPLSNIHWSTPVDTFNEYQPGPLYIHYGTPVITAANTVLVPQRTNVDIGGVTEPGFQVNAFNGNTGVQMYTLFTDYTSPATAWIPSYGATLALGSKYYYPGGGGTVYLRNSPDSTSGTITRLAFYGLANYQSNFAAFNSTVSISTPITADRFGNIFFGFIVSGTNPAGLVSGLARISASGGGSWVSAQSLAGGDSSISQIQMNCAPATNAAGTVVYVGVSGGDGTSGYLVSANATTLAPMAHVFLNDPSNGLPASILDESSAAPTVGPDGDVYYGVFESSCCLNHDRGWLLHFNSTLSTQKLSGAFGWDTTATIVARSLLPSYTGSSSYLLLTKYNNYAETGGNGLNYVAITDPNNPMTDPITGVSVMNVVIEQLGPHFDGQAPGSVHEWCINSAAIDPATKSAIVNSEDGYNYRWDLTTNTLSQAIALTSGVGEAYTPTVIGPDGTVYAINDGVLFAIGQ
jgi:hypothetical protein